MELDGQDIDAVVYSEVWKHFEASFQPFMSVLLQLYCKNQEEEEVSGAISGAPYKNQEEEEASGAT